MTDSWPRYVSSSRPCATPRLALLALLPVLLAGLALGGCASDSSSDIPDRIDSSFELRATDFLKNLKQEFTTPVVGADGSATTYTLSGAYQMDVRRTSTPEEPFVGFVKVRVSMRPGQSEADTAVGLIIFTWAWEDGHWVLASAELTPDGSTTEQRLLPPYRSKDDPLTRKVLAAGARTPVAP
jgi:hypothetical protein